LISNTTAGTHMKMVVAYVDPERFEAIREVHRRRRPYGRGGRHDAQERRRALVRVCDPVEEAHPAESVRTDEVVAEAG